MIASNAALTPFINAAANQITARIVDGMAFQFAAGIMAAFSRPLGAGAMASPMLPNLWQLSLATATQPQPQAQWTASVGQGGRGNIDLGDGNTLELNENNSEITIRNAATGEVTRIWGDPHVEIDGKHAFDFWGTTTFTLENGTKVTVNTEQWGGNPNAYVASQLVITRGQQAITVDGISQNTIGDLKVTMGQNGQALDAAHRDGYTLHENAKGSGWNTELGNKATQADLDVTRVGAAYGPGSTAPSIDEAGKWLGAFLTFGVFIGVLASFGEQGSDASSVNRLARERA